jgi:HAMP domain-containing protein
MVALVLSLIILLLIAAVCVLGLWGTTNAATALTLATTNAVEQTTIAVLTCALLAMLPIVLFGAFKLGEVLGEHKHAQADDAMRVSAPPMEQLARGDVVKALPSPELPALPSDVSVTRAPHAPRRARARVQAMRIAQRWFR